MNIRSIVIGLLVLAVGIGGFALLKSKKKPPERLNSVAAIKTVATVPVKNGTVSTSIPVTGKLVAADKIEIYAEVTGIFQSQAKDFKEGIRFSAGETLLKLDDSEFRLNLISQKSTLLNNLTQLLPDLKIDFPQSYPQWEEYLSKVNIQQSLPDLPKPQSDKERYYLTSRNIYSLFYSIRSLEEKLGKYIIRAPFSGVVAEALVNQGTNVSPGQKLGEFINPNHYELEAAVSLKEINFIKVGDEVNLTSPDITGNWKGKVKRISDRIDPATQSVRIFISVSGEHLKEGMYLAGTIGSGQVPNAMEISRKLLVDDNKVFLVNDTVLAMIPVTVVKYNESTAVVQGLPEGATLMNEMVVGAYAGMPVQTVNQPKP